MSSHRIGKRVVDDDEDIPQSIDEWIAAEEARENELRSKRLKENPEGVYFDDNKYIPAKQRQKERLETLQRKLYQKNEGSQSPDGTPEPSVHLFNDESFTEIDPKFVRTTNPASLFDQAADLIRLRHRNRRRKNRTGKKSGRRY
ncbi:hypothetical protein DSO57_1027162 [Entomophthora muscae]|uniref:Uncharacterized protein n=1 Tax=Entomophthora muscae TaxID=34485 RepID=A0ACC2TPQ3_9FUNG|nr:hypothetical protein DSO57_1027162 [Entomophthora muscae]